jgi:muramoyltetrapeptide carboxypeptidase
MIQPKLLQPGDRIAVIAPARKVSSTDITVALEILKSWNVELILGENLFTDQHSYLSASDENRLDDFQRALDDPTINAIVCARGGYGSTRIIDSLDFTKFKKNPKWITGFSDITAVHLKIATQQIQSIHGTMPVLFPKEGARVSIESLKSLLFTGNVTLNAEFNSYNRLGKSAAYVVGGNLSLLVDSIGTGNEIQTHENILVLEEIDEYFYKVDRMITQLKRSGKLKNLKGLVIGHMTEIKESTLPFKESIETIIMNAVSEYDFPVGFNFPTGHENPNCAWIHGGKAQLSVTEKGSNLSFKANIA